jgi:UDP-GlcNAc:undecaprenyl-phosphate GlcNAc-1-phosphate transferase
MSVIIAVITGFLAGRFVWLLARPVFYHGVFLRENYRGIALPTGVGICFAFVLLLVESVRVLWGAAGVGAQEVAGYRAAVLLCAVGFGLAGLIDDVVGEAGTRGFRGHLRALANGRLTTGSLKLFMGMMIALLAASVGPANTFWQVVADAALIALCANLANLFDRAPGRVIKVSAVGFLILAIGTALPKELTGTAVVIGAAAALFLDDMRERIMLGDAGSNILGAVIGAGIVFTVSTDTRIMVLVIVAILNVISEVVSFGRVIDSVKPIRAVDRAGRRPVAQS